jgi:hypothetical protein
MREIRELFFGHGDKCYVDDRDYLETIRMMAEFTKWEKIESGQYAYVKGEALDAEMDRLNGLYNDMLLTEVDRVGANLRAARIPFEEVSNRTLRMETPISREIDWILNRFERLQRLRQGHPPPPQLEV